MARARNIKPSFFENEELAEIDPYGRLLFISLWTQADKEGRLECRPKRIGAKAFPYESVPVEKLLDELRTARFIEIYEVEGHQYIQIANFVKHQNPHKNEKASEIPGPEKARNDAASSRVREISGNSLSEPEKIGTARADSPLLNPESTTPPNPPASAVGKVSLSRGGDLLGDPPDAIPDEPKPASPGYTDRFERWWAEYPRKESKSEAFKVWKRLSEPKRQAAEQDVIERQRAKHDPGWLKESGQFVPQPPKYLRRERWTDEWSARGATHEHNDDHLRGGEAARKVREIALREHGFDPHGDLRVVRGAR